MELIDRYLQAIRFWLPKKQRNDILAELSEDLRSQIEDKEAELGRKMNDVELEALLKQIGDPLLVAGRYLPQQHLVGPVLFPIYCFVLKMFALVFIPWLLLWLGHTIFSPAYRAQDPFHQLAGLWTAVLSSFFFVTVGFAFVERFLLKSWMHKDWEPSKLPPIKAGTPSQFTMRP
jgi:hypothetical protein